LFDESQLVARYRRAAVFAYPSLAERGETFGLAVLEAMAAGAAPVVSSLACFRDFIRPGENGVVFSHRAPNPATALAVALAPLLRDDALRSRLRSAAARNARDYALADVAERYLADFRNLLPAGDSARRLVFSET
jgi:glycosyltransferase involved in cell wall biosynthesis